MRSSDVEFGIFRELLKETSLAKPDSLRLSKGSRPSEKLCRFPFSQLRFVVLITTSRNSTFLLYGKSCVWLAPGVAKMIESCADWLPERVIWRYLAPSELPAVARNK